MRESGGEPPSVPRYQSLEKLGEGGQAEVYRAWDGELKRRVALKVLHESPLVSEDVRRRFEREARLMAGLSHPNVVAVYDVVTSGERLCLVMELIEGPPLDRVLAERKLGMRELVGILHQACLGVAAAHEKGIVHRDLKPGNILLTPEGKAKVGDFGLAHVADGATKLTATGAPLGTPVYMAPEQVEGTSGGISPRTDVYALGAILYEMATGSPPHAGRTVAELYAKILGAEPATPRSRNAKVPRDLETVIVKALEKEPSRRYADARELAEDLGRWLEGEAIHARPATWGYRARKFVRRRKAVVGVAVAGVALAVGLATYLVPKWRGELRSRVEKQQQLDLERARRLLDFEARERARPHLAAGNRWLEEMRLQRIRPDLPPEALNRLRDRAVECFRRAEAECADDPEPHLGIAKAFLYCEDKKRAREEVEKAIRVSPTFATAYIERALSALGEYEETVDRAKQQGSEPPREERGRILTDLEAAARHAKSPEEHARAAAYLAFLCRDFEKAQARFKEYGKLVPGDADEVYWMAHALFHLGGFEEAEAILGENLRMVPRHAESYLLRGWARMKRRNLGGAVTDCSQAIELRSGYRDAFVTRSALMILDSRYALAVKDCDEAIRIDPEDARAYCNRANARCSLEDYDAALADYDRALRIAPNYEDAYFNRGTEYRRRRNWADAIADLTKAIELDSKFVRAYIERGFVFVSQREWDSAIADFDRGIKLGPKSASAHFGRGSALMGRGGDPEGAIADFTRVIDLNPDHAEAYYMRGRIYRTKGDFAAAAADFTNASRLAPPGSFLRDQADADLKRLNP